jgi:hypothetical protein
MTTVRQMWESSCPKCGRDDQIDVAAMVWVRLFPDGTDQDEAQNTDTEFNQQSGAICAACGFNGNLGDFKVEG